MTIMLRRSNGQPTPVNISFKYKWANNIYLGLATSDGQEFEIGANWRELYHLLTDIREQCLPHTPAGIIRGDPDESEPPQEFNLLTVDDLNGDPAHDWPLIAARFPWLADTVPAQYQSQSNGKETANGDPQLASDLAAIAPLRDQLLDDEGKLVYGGQSRIAEVLGVTNGGSYRQRILNVRDALENEIERREAA